jgi:Holliday junction resolvasome RuvABC endonuclease subunit
MNILALDCATRTGWATLINGAIESGVQDFSKRRGESNGMMFLRFRAWLHQSFDMAGMKMDVIAYEQAHHRGGAAVEICVNLTGRAQEFAASIGAETIAPHTATIKKFVTGRGNADKDAMVAWFKRETGRDAIDDNEADALAILRFVMNELGVTA